MKRLILLALILCVSVSALFAVNNFLTVSASPYASQSYSSSLETKYTSDYGFGFKAGYRYFAGSFLLGADVSYQNYRYTVNGNQVKVGGVQILAKVGGKLIVTNGIDLNADFGVGMNIAISRLSTNCNPMLGANASLSFHVAGNVAITVGADVYVEWAKARDSEFKSVQWSIVPSLGVEIEL